MSEKEKGNLKQDNPCTNFPRLMMEMNAGATANVIGAMLTKLGWAVSNTNRAGSLTIDIKVQPDNSADNSYLGLSIGMKIKEPKMNKGHKTEDSYDGAIVWINRQGKMTTTPPVDNHNGQIKIATETEEQVQIREVR